MEYELVTAPATEPVSLAEAKAHLRVDGTVEDTHIAALIADAREWAERYTRRGLVTQTWRAWAQTFPADGCAMELLKAPVVSISSIKYVDTAGTLTTLDAAEYVLSARSQDKPARVLPAYGKAWPAAREQPDAVQVEFVCGYGAAAAVPATFKQAMLLHIGWRYEHREPGTFGAVPGGAFEQFRNALEQVLADRRVFTFG